MLELVRRGMDVFDSSYAHVLTEKFVALLVSKDLSASEEGQPTFRTVDLKADE